MLAIFGVASSIGGLVLTVAKALVRCRTCMAIAAVLGLLFGGAVYGVHIEHAKTEARIAADHAEAERLRQERDAQISRDLEGKYQPTISTLEQQAARLQKQVDDYANKKPAAAHAADSCKLGADALRLRNLPDGRRSAGAVQGNASGRLRKNPH